MKTLTLILLIFTQCAFSKDFISENMKLKQKLVYQDGESPIWGMSFLDANKLLFTERKGVLKLLDLKSNKVLILKKDFKNIDTNGQGGLLDLLIHKETNKDFIYISYSYKREDGLKTTALFKGEFNGKSIINGKNIYFANAYSKNSHHYGSRILIHDNFIFLSVGERGERDKAQLTTADNGSILRLNLDGSIPKTNTFKNLDGRINGIYSYGHRNPQGLVLTPDGKTIIDGEFGPQGGDEINLILQGKNYGWPIITYGEEYGGGKIGEKIKEGYMQPLAYWLPSISFSGISFYQGNKIKAWKNNLFLAGLASKQIRRVVFDKDYKVIKQESLLENSNERFRVIKMSPDESLYYGTDSGKIGKIELQ